MQSTDNQLMANFDTSGSLLDISVVYSITRTVTVNFEYIIPTKGWTAEASVKMSAAPNYFKNLKLCISKICAAFFLLFWYFWAPHYFIIFATVISYHNREKL